MQITLCTGVGLLRKARKPLGIKGLMVLVAAALLISCAKPSAIDGSSEENFRASVLALSETLGDEDRQRFMRSLIVVGENKGGRGWSSIDSPGLEFLALVNGKKPVDIEIEAEAIQITREISDTTALIGSIQAQFAELNRQISLLDTQNTVREALATLPVSRAESRPPRKDFFNIFHTVTFDVTNNTKTIVRVTAAEAAVSYGDVSETYKFLGGSDCFSSSLSLTGKILPGETTTYTCSVSGKISGDTATKVTITGGEISGLGSYDPDSALRLKPSHLPDLRAKRDQVRSQLIQACDRLEELTGQQCLWQ